MAGCNSVPQHMRGEAVSEAKLHCRPYLLATGQSVVCLEETAPQAVRLAVQEAAAVAGYGGPDILTAAIPSVV